MVKKNTMQTVTNMHPEQLGESFAALRLCSPNDQIAIERSLSRVGQLSPLLAYCAQTDRFELIDGFKRLRAARTLGWCELRVQICPLQRDEAKLCMLASNAHRGLSELEEAWLIRSLHREDGWPQSQLAIRFGRDKSWVCRRLMLAEALNEEMQANLRLGLLSATTARNLCRLPRDNQSEVATVIMQRGMTSRQVSTLIDAYLRNSDAMARKRLLEDAGKLAVQTEKGSCTEKPPRSVGELLVMDAVQLKRVAGRLHGRLVQQPLMSLGAEAAHLVMRQLDGMQAMLESLLRTLRRATEEVIVPNDPKF